MPMNTGDCVRRSTGRSSVWAKTSAAEWSTSSSRSCSTAAPMRARDDQREALRQRVEHWVRRLKAEPRIVRVQHMTRKWGSCSTSGIVTLAEDLADQEIGFQDFVVVHEL